MFARLRRAGAEADLDSGRSAVVQLVSTGEALMERRIAEIPASEWDDINVDLTPRETFIKFLAHAFAVQLQEPFTDNEGNVMSRPVFDEGRIFVWRPTDGRTMDPTTRTAQAIHDRLGFTEIARRERDAIAAFEYERVTACQELMRPDAP